MILICFNIVDLPDSPEPSNKILACLVGFEDFLVPLSSEVVVNSLFSRTVCNFVLLLSGLDSLLESAISFFIGNEAEFSLLNEVPPLFVVAAVVAAAAPAVLCDREELVTLLCLGEEEADVDECPSFDPHIPMVIIR